MTTKTYESAWVEIYLRAKREHCEAKRKLAERKLVELGIIDDQIAEEALIESYDTILTN